ncbi:B3/4 domain-containing protein [Patescibacteria group bacterium]
MENFWYHTVMKICVEKKIFDIFPGVLLGFVIARGINNEEKNSEVMSSIHDAEEKLRNNFSKTKSVNQHSRILPWRNAYKAFGSNPHDYRNSIEALVRRAIKGKKLYSINTLVDLYNLISLKYIVPVGGEDINSISGDVQLDFANGTEYFIRLGGEKNEPPSAGEVVWKDDQGVLCRRWNWREADRTKLTENTKNAIIVIEGLPPVVREDIENAAKELANLIQKYCGGFVEWGILDQQESHKEIN